MGIKDDVPTVHSTAPETQKMFTFTTTTCLAPEAFSLLSFQKYLTSHFPPSKNI